MRWITKMDPGLYQAASKGEIHRFGSILAEELDNLVMIPTKNTILHTNIIFQNPKKESTKFLEEILEKRPSLLLKVNADKDTALHLAAKFGCVRIITVLINHAEDPKTVKHMLRMTNNDGNTALHLAVQFDNRAVVKRLIEEDCEYMYPPNSYGKPPLFIAAQRNNMKMMELILDECSSIAYEGPDGMTALHIAAFQVRGSTKRILQESSNLTKATDNKGWAPLHHAVYAKNSVNVIDLLEHDASAACIPDKDRKMTPLHIAASLGRKDLMVEIVSRCRECCEMVDNRGWNYLHFAVLSLSIEKLKEYIEANPLVSDHLMYQMDTENNTPFHLCASLHGKEMVPISGIQQKTIPHGLFLRNKEKVKQHIQELEQEGLLRIWKEKKVERLVHDEEFFKEMEKAKESQLVVAALIATVTFAASFTLPGGYESEKGHTQGFAVLSKNSAFQAFGISNTIALLFSITAVFIHFVMSIESIFKGYTKLFVHATVFTMIAMAAMVVAFATGTYAVLAHSLWLAILTCVLGLSFFGLISVILYKVIKRTRERTKFDEMETSRRRGLINKSTKSQQSDSMIWLT